MVNLSPKEMFMSDPDRVKEYGNMAHGITLQTAVTLALSKFCIDEKPNTDELSGARKFIDVLLNIGERPEEHEAPEFRSIATVIPPRPQPSTRK